MKSLIALTLLFSLGAQAGTLRKVFKNDKAPAAQKYLAVFTNSVNSDNEYTVVFGEGMNYRVFETNVVTYPSGPFTVTSLDEQAKLTQQGTERDKSVKVTVTDMRNTKLVEGTYTVYNSATSTSYAQNVDKMVEAEFTKYRLMDSPATPAELRRLFKQLSFDGSYNDPVEFPTFDLQIEWSTHMTPPNAQKASAYVTMAG